jgi:3-hydroxyacyl-[acyl-carrier-protein] dehydratase
MTANRTLRDLEVKRFRKTASTITAQIHVPHDCRYFDGHFPDHPILPGVAQFALITRLLEHAIGAGTRITRFRRAKFTSPVGPDATLTARIELSPETNRGSWNLATSRSEVSSGDFEWTAGVG